MSDKLEFVDDATYDSIMWQRSQYPDESDPLHPSRDRVTTQTRRYPDVSGY